MKATLYAAVAAMTATKAAAHATFQQLWVNGVDFGSQCVRLPPSNNPVTNVGSTDFRCNVGGTRGMAGKCPAKAGDVVTVEMHQQNGDRSCKNEAIGGEHYGPVQVYLTKVTDASTADGSTGWFKIFSDGWAPNSSGTSADDDFWGTKDMNTCCGQVDVKIPADIEPGDYLMRAEALALHVAGQLNGAQFYMSCYQLTIAGNGTATPATVKFPGAYAAKDPGVLFDIHAKQTTYVVPGPTLYAGGSTKSAGSGCGAAAGGCKATCTAGKGPTGTAEIVAVQNTAAADAGSSMASCATVRTAAAYQQCGGSGFAGDGCTTCPSGFSCKAQNGYYSQCTPS